jgi:hypothetical protein
MFLVRWIHSIDYLVRVVGDILYFLLSLSFFITEGIVVYCVCAIIHSLSFVSPIT